jgi:3-methylcrotonyl-CoA carboxylase beta subunit
MWREGGREGERLSMIIYLILTIFVDELHGLALGRNIIKNLHMAAKKGLKSGLQNMNSKYKEPLFDVKELRSIAPTDHKQQFDIRSVIARIVDGSKFDEFKKLYGTVRAFAPI